MALFRRLGLRARLAIAFVAMAVLAVGTATVVSNLGLPARVDEAAGQRLEREATHLAAVAAAFYRERGRWTDGHVLAVTHLAQMSGVRVELSASGRRLSPPLPPHARAPAAIASAPVVVDGERVAVLRAQPAGLDLLTPEERHLRHSLDRLHLLAAVLSVLAAVAVAFVFAQGIAGPVRRIRRGADRLAGGDLDARVPVDGGPELAAVGAALNRLAATLAREEELRQEGLADLAHELRTPVNGLLGRIEAAQDGMLEPRGNLSAMHAEAERLARLLDDLASLGDAQRPGLLVDKDAVDVAALVRAAAERWRERFAREHVELGVDAAAPVLVTADAGRLEQVIDNLLSNALRYTPPGGSVSVAAYVEAGDAVVEVSDTGIGIPEADLPHVFKRFWRGDRSRSRATGGAGIGLAIVDQLVRAHDGRIDVRSAPGRGTTVRVLLPTGARVTAAA